MRNSKKPFNILAKLEKNLGHIYSLFIPIFKNLVKLFFLAKNLCFIIYDKASGLKYELFYT